MYISSFRAESAANKLLGTATVTVEALTGEKIPVSVLIVQNISTPLHNSIHACIKGIPHLRGLRLTHPITGDENFEISLLIGADQYWNFVGDHIIRDDGLTAMQSKLGYLLSGPLPVCQSPLSDTSIFHVSIQTTAEDDLNFWKIETACTGGHTNQSAEFIANFEEKSITRELDGGYTVKFPWRQDHAPLPTNYAISERRTRSLAHRLN